MKLLTTAVSLALGADALLPLVTSGNKFYQLQEDYTAGPEEFTLFGVDYQPGGSSGFSMASSEDILTNAAACQRDAYLLSQLGANSIRIYSVSPWNNHDECMSIFNDAGIYVLLDVNTPDSSLHRYNPEDSYTEGYLNNVFGLVDAFKGYSNLLGFIAGNEIINDDKSAESDPVYIRAVIRDVKEYISKWANRTIPVGYAAADVLEYRTETWQYFECNDEEHDSSDALSRADFFGINTYSWCSGSSDYDSSGYEDIKDTFGNSSIPIIFTEYGCNKNSPRTFDEVPDGIYGPLADVVAGAFVYEYSNEVSNYGLVDLDSDGTASMLDDFDNLKSAFSKVSLSSTTIAQTALVTGTQTLKDAPTCDSDDATSSFGWNMTLPDSPATDLLSSGGGNKNVGSLIATSDISFNTTYNILDAHSSTLTPSYSYDSVFQVNAQSNVPDATSSGSGSSQSSSKSSKSTKSSTKSTTATSSQSSSKSAKSQSKNGAPGMMALPMGLGGLAVIILGLI